MTLEFKMSIAGATFEEIQAGAAAIAGAAPPASGGGSSQPPTDGGGGTQQPPPDGGGGTQQPPPVVDIQAKYWPADSTKAAWPSLETTTLSVDSAGVVHGRPYVLDQFRARWQFDLGPDGKAIKVSGDANTTAGYQVSVNGIPITGPGGSGQGCLALTITQGMVCVQVAPGGQWLKTSAPDCPGSGLAQAGSPPAPWNVDANGETILTTPIPQAASPVDIYSKYWPSDYALAPAPSPEGSIMYVDDHGVLQGRPYLIDKQKAVWKFERDASGAIIPMPLYNGRPSWKYSVNGAIPNNTIGCRTIIIVQGQAYYQAPGGQWQKFSAIDSPGSGAQNIGQPPAFYVVDSNGETVSSASGGGGTSSGGIPGQVAPSADPPKQAVAFGATGKVIPFVGTNASLEAALAQATAGDVVSYPAAEPRGVTLNESVGVPEGVTVDFGGRWTDPALMLVQMEAVRNAPDAASRNAAVVALRTNWTPGIVFDATGLADPTGYIKQMGGVVQLGNSRVVGLEACKYGMQEASHGGTAAVRAAGFVVGLLEVDQCFLWGNQNGIGPGGTLCKIVVTNTALLDDGLSDGAGGAHNIYASSAVSQLDLGPYFGSTEDPWPKGDGGHAVKSRAKNSTNLIAPYYVGGGDSSAVDISNGSSQVCHFGAGTIDQPAGSLNHTLVGYGAEGPTNGTGGIQGDPGLKLKALCQNPNIIANGPVDLTGATVVGGPIANSGGSTLKVGATSGG